MDFVRKLFGGQGRTAGGEADDRDAMWLYVQCDNCSAPLAIRVDTRHDVSTDYETGAKFLRKEIMDSTCFRLMYADVRLNADGSISEQELKGGKFLTQQEFDAARATFEGSKRK